MGTKTDKLVTIRAIIDTRLLGSNKRYALNVHEGWRIRDGLETNTRESFDLHVP